MDNFLSLNPFTMSNCSKLIEKRQSLSYTYTTREIKLSPVKKGEMKTTCFPNVHKEIYLFSTIPLPETFSVVLIGQVLQDVKVGELHVFVVSGREPSLVHEERSENGLSR